MQLVDQTNHPVVVEKKVLKIVSLVPSQTELLHYFGLEDEIVGITKFCVHPADWFSAKQKVGGTKTVDIKKVRDLCPDLIIANKEENSKADIELLRALFPVYTSDIVSLKDVYQMITDVGMLVNKRYEATALIDILSLSFQKIPKISGSVLYVIWRNPYMVAGTGTFINTMLNLIGLDACNKTNIRYDEIAADKIIELNPDYIFLSSEPYPFKDKHIKELEAISPAKIVLVDGEMFSWYGSRMLNFSQYIQEDLIPKLH